MLGLVLLAATAAPAAPANPDPKSLAPTPAEQAKARALVEKLGSPAYEDREQAQADLAGMGRKAVPALAEALAKNPSAEVRARCQALYPRARADDLQARLDCFAADAAGKFEHDLPGWPEFRLITNGGGKAAREVFVELARNPLGRELVFSDLPPADRGQRISIRKTELYRRRFGGIRRPGEVLPEAPADDVLAIMYAEVRIPGRHLPRSTYGNAVFTSAPFVAAVTGGTDKAAVYRAVAGKWAATRDEALLMTQALPVAVALEVPEAADLGVRMLKTPGVTAPYKAQAAMAVAKVGNPKHLPALEAVFKEEGVVQAAVPVVVPGGARPAAGAQMRDVALVAAVLLTGQDPKEYGFEEVSPRRDTRYLSGAWAMPADHRAAAFDKWKTWRDAHPDFGKDR